ncbi:MAG: methionyl-tRNA formyltransferase, partial [Treponema porcinum]|nr:methionyl-tRNA formyltransferase [Treponema porcinum]
DWSKSAEAVDALVRAYFPSPAAWTTENGLFLKILSAVPVRDDDSFITEEMRAASPGTVCAFVKQAGILVRCGTGFLAVKNLQRQGKNAVDFKAFMNGARDFIGTHLE